MNLSEENTALNQQKALKSEERLAWLTAHTAGTFMSNKTFRIAVLSCRLDALADSVSENKNEENLKTGTAKM